MPNSQVKVRYHPRELENDIALKLRVANATHTALAHAMALSSLVNTDALCSSSSPPPAQSEPASSLPPPKHALLLRYLDSLFATQILPAAANDGISAQETNSTWEDWRQRLRHPHFGLSTFFITQNGAAKGGIRLGPTIRTLIEGFGGGGAAGRIDGRSGHGGGANVRKVSHFCSVRCLPLVSMTEDGSFLSASFDACDHILTNS